MVKWKLLKISYKDGRNGINLTAYADTLVMDESDPNKKRLVMIRFGGDPEPVRGMADAIYGGGDIDVETQDFDVIASLLLYLVESITFEDKFINALKNG